MSSLAAWDAGDAGAFLAASAAGERDVEVEARLGARISLRVWNERVTHSELRSLVPSLSFLPRDISLLDGSPSVRRLFLDKICALVSPLYARRLAEYQRLARQRAALLRRGRNGAIPTLRAMVSPMAQLGGWIRKSRGSAAGLLAEALRNGSELLPFEIGVVLRLRDGEKENSAPEGFSLEDFIQGIADALNGGLERELRAGAVLAGPHRDDLLFSCLGRPAALALSRGQKRRVVMAAVLAAGQLIETRLRLKPILLLDDAAAELDEEGRALMAQSLAATGWQVFAAAAGAENPFGGSVSAVWEVREGKIAGP
jgi:DNA replication and repair protein RecF